MWITINGRSFSLKGKHYRKVVSIIKPGDIVIRRFEGYLDRIFLPGWFNHAGIYIGHNTVIHAISDGIVTEDIIDFMRTDHMIVLRPPSKCAKTAVTTAVSLLGRPYDFSFNFNESLRFSCTELVDHCYKGLISGKKRLGRRTVVADDIVETNELTVVWDSRKDV